MVKIKKCSAANCKLTRIILNSFRKIGKYNTLGTNKRNKIDFLASYKIDKIVMNKTIILKY